MFFNKTKPKETTINPNRKVDIHGAGHDREHRTGLGSRHGTEFRIESAVGQGTGDRGLGLDRAGDCDGPEHDTTEFYCVSLFRDQMFNPNVIA